MSKHTRRTLFGLAASFFAAPFAAKAAAKAASPITSMEILSADAMRLDDPHDYSGRTNTSYNDVSSYVPTVVFYGAAARKYTGPRRRAYSSYEDAFAALRKMKPS